MTLLELFWSLLPNVTKCHMWEWNEVNKRSQKVSRIIWMASYFMASSQGDVTKCHQMSHEGMRCIKRAKKVSLINWMALTEGWHQWPYLVVRSSANLSRNERRDQHLLSQVQPQALSWTSSSLRSCSGPRPRSCHLRFKM